MGNTIIMTKKEAERYDVIQRLIKKEIDGTQAAKALRLSVRQIKRIKARVIKEKERDNPGMLGVIHKGRGRKSNNQINKSTLQKTIKIIKDNYADFSSQLTYEKLQENHNSALSYSTVRRVIINEGLSQVKPRKANQKHFSQRERKASYGEMIQHDGSYHNWFEGRCTDKGTEKE